MTSTRKKLTAGVRSGTIAANYAGSSPHARDSHSRDNDRRPRDDSIRLLMPRRRTARRAKHSFAARIAAVRPQYGDSMPPECAGLDTEVLNDRGMQVRLIEGEATRQKRLLREAEEAKVRKEKDTRALRDRTLIETYLTVEDIERLRDSAARAARRDSTT